MSSSRHKWLLVQEADVGGLSLSFELIEFPDSGCEERDVALVGRPYNRTEPVSVS